MEEMKDVLAGLEMRTEGEGPAALTSPESPRPPRRASAAAPLVRPPTPPPRRSGRTFKPFVATEEGRPPEESATRAATRHPLNFLLQVARERTRDLDGEPVSVGRASSEASKKYRQELSRSPEKKKSSPEKKSSADGKSPEMVRRENTRQPGRRVENPQGVLPVLEQLNGNLEGNCNLSSIYHGDWPIDRVLWNSAPSSFGESDSLLPDTSSIMSFSSNTSNAFNARKVTQPFGTKVEMVYSLLSMLGAHDREDMSKTLLAMSQSQESCIAMRQSGCLPLLVQLLHSNEEVLVGESRSRESRRRASAAMHNIVHAYVDDKQGRRETRVLRLLEQIRDYCDRLRDSEEDNFTNDQQLGPAIATLMKLSFDEDHRNAMCQLGGLHAIGELIQTDQTIRGTTSNQFSITLRRYAGMALTNLTFGDGANKALLCSLKPFMHALVAQLHSPSEDLRQVTASVLRNLSWRADSTSKQILREVGAVPTLMKAAMEALKESTLKSILSALWNLSAHCSGNKVDICAVDGALAFLVTTLGHKNPAIVENGGGILRNISSHIAVHEEHRAVLRKHNCLHVLLQHLKSSSLTVVSNACGTLWNLSARCPEDQKTLWDMGAVDMLKNLVHSKHKMISMGSSAALKNLLSSAPQKAASSPPSLVQRSTSFSNMPSLLVRKQRALEEDIDQNLSETCDNIDSPKTSPTHMRSTSLDNRFIVNGNYPPYPYTFLPGRMYHSINGHVNYQVPRSESRESVGSTQSEPPFLRNNYNYMRNRRFSSLDQRYYPGRGDRRSWAGPGIREEEFGPSRPFVERQSRSPEKKRRSADDLAAAIDVNRNHQVAWQEVDEEVVKDPFRGPSPSSSFRGPTVKSLRNSYSESTQDRFSEAFREPSLENFEDPSNPESLRISSTFKEPLSSPPSGKRFLKTSPPPSDPKVNNYVSCQSNSGIQPDVPRVFTNKRTLSALRKSGQECSLQIHHLDNYAETDLDDPDQPTDYSQKYKEEELSRDPSSCNEDSLKVYCTEGTPLNFSTSSSLTDLREVGRTDPKPNEQEKNREKIKKNEKEIKSVTFEVLETPLMFSRCSSLGSLNSCEQHSIHEDRSSVISDFSRRASEVVSPSDLPDSPSQTVPPSPRRKHMAGGLEGVHLAAGPLEAVDEEEDVSKVFAVEGTPVEFSCATSLSSLTINSAKEPEVEEEEEEEEQRSDEDEASDEENLLAACINNGMPRAESSPRAKIGIPVRSRPSNIPKRLTSFGEDSMRAYRTEGTPSGLSQATSLGELSALSAASDSGSSVCDDNENLLQQCIQTGMPKSKIPARKGLLDIRKDNRKPPLEEAKRPNELLRRPDKPRIREKPRPLHACGFAHGSQRKPSSEGTDSPKAYMVEGTPLVFSRNDSLSSLSCEDETETRRAKPEEPLSRNGSLSSLSAESTSEQALLEECINTGKPKAKRKRAIPILCKPRPSHRPPSLHREPSADRQKSESSRTQFTEERKSAEESKIKEDERSKENLKKSESSGPEDDLKGKADGPGLMATSVTSSKSSPPEFSESAEICKEASRLAEKVRAEADEVSSLSCISDLDDIKPPSVMADLSTDSIAESRVPMAIRRALATGSSENLLENIDPPSAMDLLTGSCDLMTSSCASLNSISSDVLGSPNLRSGSEMYQRLNAAAAMVQVYSRELNNIMNNKSSSNSEMIDHVNPPSVFVEAEDWTEFDGTVPSDTEMEEELPEDEICSSGTLRPRTDELDGSTDNVSTLAEDSPLKKKKEAPVLSPTIEVPSPESSPNQEEGDISAEEFQRLQDDANKVVSTLHRLGQEEMLEDETLSLVSNDSEGETYRVISPRIVRSHEDVLSAMQEMGAIAAPHIPDATEEEKKPAKFDTSTFTRKGKGTSDENRPKLVKQRTFTKDSPTHKPSDPTPSTPTTASSPASPKVGWRRSSGIKKEEVAAWSAHQRSASASSLGAASSSSSSSARPSPTRKQVTSKIASIWKKGGDSKPKSVTAKEPGRGARVVKPVVPRNSRL